MKRLFLATFLMLNLSLYGQIYPQIFSRVDTFREHTNIINLDKLYLIYNGDRYNIDTVNVKVDSGLFEIMWIDSGHASDSFKLVGLSKLDTTHTNYFVLLRHDESYLQGHNVGDTISLIVRRMFKIVQKKEMSGDKNVLREEENNLYILKTGGKEYKIRCSFLHRLIATAKPIPRLDK